MIVNLKNIDDLLKKEDLQIEWKEKIIFDSNPNNEIEIALTSIANRIGGTLLFGVKNNGELEGATFDNDNDGLKITNIAHNNCSPPVTCSTNVINHKGSDVLIVTIQKRKDMPHAVIKREGAEIKSRKYYIRSGNGKRLVDDITLNYLFKNSEDPQFNLLNDIRIWYNSKELIFFQPVTFSTYSFYLLPLLQDLKENEISKNYLLSNYTNIRDLLLEVIPYGILNNLALTFISNWKVKIETLQGRQSITGLESPLENQPIHVIDIPNNGISLLNKHINLKKVFAVMSIINFPKDTVIELKVEKSINQSILKILNPFFKIEIFIVSSSYFKGLPQIISNKYFLSSTDDFACWNFDIRFETYFEFPDKKDEYFNEHLYFVRTLYDLINENWNWNKLNEVMKDQRIDQINYTTRKILSLLENKPIIK